MDEQRERKSDSIKHYAFSSIKMNMHVEHAHK